MNNPGLSSESIGSEALRKAIERNRAKVARQESAQNRSAGSLNNFIKPKIHQEIEEEVEEEEAPQPQFKFEEEPPPRARPAFTRPNPASGNPAGASWQSPSEFARLRAQRQAQRQSSFDNTESETPRMPPPRPRPQMPSRPPPTRTTINTNDDVEFISPPVPRVRRNLSPNLKAHQVPTANFWFMKYVKEEHINYLVKFAWGFCAILFLRLIFADRGVVDFYQRLAQLKNKEQEYAQIQKTNEQTISDIKKITSDRMYQRRLVRDSLGFIANDEYLILFPQEKN